MNDLQHQDWMTRALIKIEFIMAMADRTPGTLTALMALWGDYDRKTEAIEKSLEAESKKREKYRAAVDQLLDELQGLILPGTIEPDFSTD